jgi:ABC-type phosphate transport system ATPase subunit
MSVTMRDTTTREAPKEPAQRSQPAADAAASAPPRAVALRTEKLSAYYGNAQAVGDVDLTFEVSAVTAIIGPSGCGKSTLLRCLNRMHETTPGARATGHVRLGDVDVYAPATDPVEVRSMVGMVFQKPNPFPMMSVYDNVAAGPRLRGWKMSRREMDELVRELSHEVTIVIVTHNMQQASRVSERTAFMLAGDDGVGRLVEFGKTDDLFTLPRDPRTEAYITGRFG